MVAANRLANASTDNGDEHWAIIGPPLAYICIQNGSEGEAVDADVDPGDAGYHNANNDR